MKRIRALKNREGGYTYKNYRIKYKGWDKQTQSCWWEATNTITNCVEFREHTMAEIMDDIDEYCGYGYGYGHECGNEE